MSDERDYVVIACKYSTNGVAVFWRANDAGYTSDLDKAGRYTRAEARSRERKRGNDFDDIGVPFALAEAAMFRTVSDDNVHDWRRLRREGKELPSVSDCKCKDPGPFRGSHCRAANGFAFASDDRCGCQCHRALAAPAAPDGTPPGREP